MFHCHNVILFVLLGHSAVYGHTVRNEDICGPHNGRRLYLELNEHGVLYAKNISFIKNAPRQQGNRVYVTNSSHDQCSLELVTCPSCVITATFKSLALPHHCGYGVMMTDSPCRCDYVWISEPPYEDVSGTPFCGLYAPLVYKSSTRTLSISLLYSQSHRHAFTLEYTAERNRVILKGARSATGPGKTANNTGGGILTSPFFPARYPRDLGMEYIVTCPAEAPSCRVRVLFSDFQLATVSIMEFYDWNGQRLDVSSGARFRPPVIVSSGPSLIIRFYANGGTGLGYKAFYSFVVGHLYDKSVQPITDCGGYVENLGGAITMMDMVGEGVKTYDCVWLIRPPKNFLHMKTHMYLKTVTFASMAGNTELIIKQGPTSALTPLEILRHPASQLQPPRLKEHVAPVASGFHVSLRGTFGSSSRLAIAYAAFSYTDCFTGSDFLCQNHRCIPSQLNCDGFDHCGDNSDEPATCFQDWDVEPQDRKWHLNKANYYFPKIDRYPDLKTATLVFVASSLGLIILISALIVLLYRMGARARQQRELQSRLQTISELLDGARIDEITVSDDPPVYEAPPGYDEVVKVGFEAETGGRKKRKNGRREPRSRSTSGQRSNTLLPFPRCELESQPPAFLALETASTSRSSQTTPVPLDENKRVPDSPPPPYVTPPGTVPRSLGLLSSPYRTSETEQISAYGTRARLSWLQTDGCDSPSASDQPPHAGPAALPVDVEALGAYLENCASNAAQISASQSSGLTDASGGASVAFGGKSEDVDNGGGDRSASCACEGACGCATRGSYEAIDGAEFPERETTIRARGENDDLSARNAIVKLLGRSKNATGTSRDVDLNSTTISSCCSSSSSSSTPYGTIGRCGGRNLPRNLSVCSKDTCVSKLTVVGSGDSLEKLNGEFDIAADADSPADASIGVRKIASSDTSNRNCEYSSRHLGSLCEGVAILDSFLARRGASDVRPGENSVAVAVLGSPERCLRRVASLSLRKERKIRFGRNRIWRSHDANLAN